MRHLLLLGSIGFFASQAPALDRITLANGQVIIGEIVERDGGRVTIETAGRRLRFPQSRIAKVEPSPVWTAPMESVGAAIRQRDVAVALAALAEARRAGAPPDVLDRGCTQAMGAAVEIVERRRAEEVLALRPALRAAIVDGVLPADHRFTAARLLAAMEDREGAALALATLGPEELPADPAARRWIVPFLRIYVLQLAHLSQLDAVLRVVEHARALETSADDPILPVAALAASAVARDQGDAAKALQILTADVQLLWPEVAQNRAALTLKSAQTRYQATNNPAELEAALAEAKLNFPVQWASAIVPYRLEAARLALADGRADDAVRLTEDLPAGASPEVAAMQREANYRADLAKIDQNNPVELLKLAQVCLENNMLAEASELLHRCLENENTRRVAEALLVTVQERSTADKLERANAAQRIGDHELVVKLTKEVLEEARPDDPILKDARRLLAVAEKARTIREAKLPYLAEILVQEAERNYFSGQHAEAFRLLQLALEQYPTAPAAARATKMIPIVIASLKLDYLEGRAAVPPSIDTAAEEAIPEELRREVERLLAALAN